MTALFEIDQAFGKIQTLIMHRRLDEASHELQKLEREVRRITDELRAFRVEANDKKRLLD